MNAPERSAAESGALRRLGAWALTPEGIIGLGIFLIVFGVYLRNMAPTTSFWDCGEFIACSYTLGIPHPPGAPLYLLVGRLFSLVPIGGEIAARVNFISVLTSALTILFIYLITVRMIAGPERSGDGFPQSLVRYGGSAVAALLLAFSYTFWFNAVEAEVYAPSLFFTTLGIWLALRWVDRHEQPDALRYLLFIAYLFGLAGGVHLLCLLAIPSIVWLVLATRPRTLARPQVWIGAVLLFGLAYTTYYALYIRSGLNPLIDENNPENWTNFYQFLQRQQYGTESLLVAMFDRKAPFWEYQMGYMFLKYLLQQFSFPLGAFPAVFREAVVLVPTVPLLIGLLGAVMQFRRDPVMFVMLLGLFLPMGVGLALYLNMADPQPRERDYIFAGSFVILAIWVGLGAAAIIEEAVRFAQRRNWGRLVPVTVVAALLSLPLSALALGYHEHDRADNFIAHDYGYNILASCEPNAILFTNGDNDTFPLWFLQEVKGFRRDVRVANLSLLNTPWYIKQLRDFEPKLRIEYTDDLIDNVLTAATDEAILERQWPEGQKAQAAGMEWELVFTNEFRILRVQDVMVLRIVRWNNWKRPIYFAVTVSPENKIGLDPHLAMQGMVFRLVPERDPDGLDPERTRHNLWEVYRYTGVTDPAIHKDDNSSKLLTNYRAAYVQLADYYQRHERDAEVLAVLDHMEKSVGTEASILYISAEIAQRSREYRRALDYLSRAYQVRAYDPFHGLTDYADLFLVLATELEREGDIGASITAMEALRGIYGGDTVSLAAIDTVIQELQDKRALGAPQTAAP